MTINILTFKKPIRVGQVATITHTFTEQDLETFGKLSQDTNPLHFSDEFVKEHGIFKKRIVHGMLLGGLISAAAGTKVPGPGSIYISQNFQFLKPAYLGELITARIEVLSGRKEKPIFTIKTDVLNPNGELLVTGKATVYNPHCFLEQ